MNNGSEKSTLEVCSRLGLSQASWADGLAKGNRNQSAWHAHPPSSNPKASSGFIARADSLCDLSSRN
jgi:hypothetical protein